jgi:Ca-activated chloride channel family protein
MTKLAMTTLSLAALLMSALLVGALAQESPPSHSAGPARPPVRQNPSMPKTGMPGTPRNASPGDAAPRFKVAVKLVNVFASVVDGGGAPYSNLRKEDFRIFEDGVEQKLAVFERESALPLSIVMALDTSLSTRKDLALEIASARRFTQDILRPVDALSLYEFSTYVSQALPFTHDERRVVAALNHLRTGPATALYDAIYLGSQALERRQGRRVIVLISDGGDTVSKTDYPEALRAAQVSEAIIYSIIMVPIEADAGRDVGGEHALIQLSQDTGGKYYYAISVAQLDEAFRQIGDELRTQYLLAYYPINRAGPEFRRIRIELTAEARQNAQRELSVRHRAGYYNSSKIQ